MLCVRSCFEFIERLFYGAVWADLPPFLFRVYRGLFLPFCSIINPHIACYARLMMKQNHQKHAPDSLRNKFQTASKNKTRSTSRRVKWGKCFVFFFAKLSSGQVTRRALQDKCLGR